MTAVQLLLPLADQGDARAQYMIGLSYDLGNGVEKDYVKAAEWFHKAAEQGKSEAQASLGLLYARGDGVPQDYVEAIRWWRMVAR